MIRQLLPEEIPRLSIEAFKKAKKLPVSILLHDIRSVLNVGAIFRSADAFRVQHIYLSGITGSPNHPHCRKTALGAELSVDWSRINNPLQFLKEQKNKNICIVALEIAQGAFMLHQWQWNLQPLLLIPGNEVYGVPDWLLNEADICLEIPQMGTKHSLNVAVSVGIVLYKLFERALSLHYF